MKFMLSMTGSVLLTACIGCGGGGPAVEDQERFKDVMNRSDDAAAAQVVRSQISTLRDAMLRGGEGSEVAKLEVEVATENASVMDPNRFSDEHKPTVSSILDKMQELKHAQGRSEAKEILDELSDLADTLPRT